MSKPLTRNELVRALKSAKRHKNPEITFWLGEDQELKLVNIGEFEIGNEMTFFFEKTQSPVMKPLDLNSIPDKWKKKFKKIQKKILKDKNKG